MIQRRSLIRAAALAPALAMPALAGQAPAAPKGKVILTVTGAILRRNAPEGMQFDEAMLEALPQGQFKGATPWTSGVVSFEGPLFSAVIDMAGVNGTTLRATALNDYAVEIPVSDVRAHPVILATRRDGKVMAVRDKGPIWVIYPMDKTPALQTETTYNRSIWQLKTIHVI